MTTTEPDFGYWYPEPVTYWHTERTVMRGHEIGHACYATIIGGRTPVEYMTDLDDLLKSALAALEAES